MRYMSLDVASEIYNCASNYMIYCHQVYDPAFKEFCQSIRQFERSLGEIDDYQLRRYIQWLRRYRFKLCSAPVPFNHPAVIQQNMLETMSKHVKLLGLTYPGIAEKAKELLTIACNLANSSENPLLDFLIKLVNQEKKNKTAVLIKDFNLIKSVEDIFARHHALRKINMLGIPQLRGGDCYDCLIVLGPARWFPEHVFSSPRAREIHVVKYSWIKDGWKPEPAFLGSSLPHGIKPPGTNLYQEEAGEDTVPSSVTYLMEPEELLPVIDWDAISVSYGQHGSSGYGQEEVEARLFLLAGDGLVFLEAAENSRALVIDLEAGSDPGDSEGNEHESPVKRIRVDDIQEGMFILLRTSGGGDYIVPVANQILKDKAKQAREMQLFWKNRLRKAVEIRGAAEVSIALKARGSPRANATNVRNWISTRNIRTQKYKDFEAIMDFIGLKNKASDYWKTAIAIEKAHRQAGYHIRNLLLKKVLDVDLNELEKTGKMDFELEQGGGTLTAFRVEDKSPGYYTVPVSRLGHYLERDV